jgi:hypothetical protein
MNKNQPVGGKNKGKTFVWMKQMILFYRDENQNTL